MGERTDVVDQDSDSSRSLPWPLFTIDFEASSLAPGSYPIEVGVCRWISPDRPIEGWSTLIRPDPFWIAEGLWSPQSQEVHGICREELETGITPTDTMMALNAIIGSNAAFCDGGQYDVSWARRLVLAAKVPNTFKLGDFDMLTGLCDQLGYMRLVRFLDRTPARHRARDDAELLMKALARGLGLEHGTTRDIETRHPGDCARN
jgi:hypothetical protein